MQQDDSLSPVLFAPFINDLADRINALGAGVYMGGEEVFRVMYADDIVLISPNEKEAHRQLDIMSEWCSKWSMHINVKKSQIIHVRNKQKLRSNTPLFCCGQELSYMSNYKYLGFILNEHLSPKSTVDSLTSAALGSFRHLANIFKKLGNMGYKLYVALYDTYVQLILNYAAGVGI